ncbi:hypothetical protein J5N58_04215 [Rhizobium cremeum]|uniref:hypothetical protein n=1 Tax=Rhizobium cremeum TaxID=2813827 RepID=UPI001FD5C84F|nr:hypothetical protein [Rhizobium cremeum]MCJ7993816.1 hypothetical protein [Rhizobium cremeum]MCJ7998873.1 hypothetical protein [Rhizobium cremeum]
MSVAQAALSSGYLLRLCTKYVHALYFINLALGAIRFQAVFSPQMLPLTHHGLPVFTTIRNIGNLERSGAEGGFFARAEGFPGFSRELADVCSGVGAAVPVDDRQGVRGWAFSGIAHCRPFGECGFRLARLLRF